MTVKPTLSLRAVIQAFRDGMLIKCRGDAMYGSSNDDESDVNFFSMSLGSYKLIVAVSDAAMELQLTSDTNDHVWQTGTGMVKNGKFIWYDAFN